MQSPFLTRPVGLAAVAALVFAGPVVAQGLPEVKAVTRTAAEPQNMFTRLNEFKDGRNRVGGPNAAANREFLSEVAKFFLYKTTQEEYYGVPKAGTKDDELKARGADNNLDAVFANLAKHLMIPGPDAKYSLDQAEFVKEFGAALDEVIVDLLKKNPPPVVRVNIARALAVVARSGAPAHAKTITDLLKDPKTPPEVLLHAYRAAEALLSAYDPNAAAVKNPLRHSIPVPALVDLLTALDAHILVGPPVADRVALPVPVPKVPGEVPPAPVGGRLDNKTLTPEQVEVVRYFRRQAVRAMAKCRVDVLANVGGQIAVRPAYTLAKVAVNDSSLYPEVTAAETVDAVVGLCEMPPGPTLNIDEVAFAIASAVAQLGEVKNTIPDDKTIPWRTTGVRLGAAFNAWKAGLANFPAAAANAKIINGLANEATKEVASKFADGVPTNFVRVQEWRDANPPKDPKRSLYKEGDEKLSPRPLKR